MAIQEAQESKKAIRKDRRTTKEKFKCFYCGEEVVCTNYYKTKSIFYKNIEKIPYCKQCVEKLYQYYYERYVNDGNYTPERSAVRRVCMVLDIYYAEKVFTNAMNTAKKHQLNISPMGTYMKMVQLWQYNEKTYDDTINEADKAEFVANATSNIFDSEIDVEVMNFWGNGFTEEDYRFLQKEYTDWITRHECQTKAQEEVFKRICFKQLEILKATRMGEDTKSLDDTFQKLLDTAKLQPKQNSSDTVSDAQTFGTLIDKWENTRPLPEIDEELKDVDKIALYIDIFLKGHLSKMMGLKNGLSNLYTKFMKKYTVEKPEYNEEENSEVLFDTIFGSQSSDVDDNKVVV